MSTWKCDFELLPDGKGKIKLYTTDAAQDSPKAFTLVVERQKSTISNKERLHIDVTQGDFRVAERKCSMNDVRSSLTALREYGLVIPMALYNTVAKILEENYLLMEPKKHSFDVELTPSVVDRIKDMFWDFIHQTGVEPVEVGGATLYPIKVSLFDEHLKESEFSIFTPTEVKRALAEANYTRTNAGRYDYYSPPIGTSKEKFRSICFVFREDTAPDSHDR